MPSVRDNDGRRSAGGRGAAQGHRFQDEVCAYYFVLLLMGDFAEPPVETAAGALRTVTPQAALPVDDIVATTAGGGAIYVDCKSHLRLQHRHDSDLAGCLRGFAQLYLRSLSTVPSSGPSRLPWERALDLRRDRLVIALGDRTPQNSEDLLRRLVQAAEQELPHFRRDVTRPQLSSIYGFLKGLLTEEARTASQPGGRRLGDADVHFLLRLVRVIRYRFGEGQPSEREALAYLRRDILRDPGSAWNAWQALVSIAGAQHARGQAVGLHQLRALLAAQGIELAGAPDYGHDFDRLADRSVQDSARVDDVIAAGPDGIIRADRPIVAALLHELRERHVLLHGDPGCGKSWVAKQVARLWVEGMVGGDSGAALFLSAGSLLELGQDHPLLDVLRAWQPGRNLLVVDGLDRVRDAERVQAVAEMVVPIIVQSGWRVLLSIRTFDADHSHRWADISGGSYADRVLVPLLSETELDAALASAPAVHELVQAGTPELRELLLSPFNLRLLGDVVRSYRQRARPLASLAGMRTQVELLEQYWERLIRGEDGSGERERCALTAARLIWETGEMEVSRIDLVETATAVPALEAEGVFKVGQDARSRDRLSFFHDALADFACAKVLHSWGAERAISAMADTGAVIWRMPVFRLLFADALRDPGREFWPLCQRVAQERGLLALVRIVPLQALAEAVPSSEDLRPLVDWLDSGDAAAVEATRFLMIGLVQRKRASPARDGTWLELAHLLSSRLEGQFVAPLLGYLELWAERTAELQEGQLLLVNRAADAVWTTARVREWQGARLTTQAAEIIAKAFAGAPDRSREVLRTVAEEHDPHECFFLTRRLEDVIRADPHFAADLMLLMLGYEESSEEQIPLGGSHVMSLVQSKRQAWEMVWHRIQDTFPKLLAASPAEGARVAIAVGELLWAEHRPSLLEQRRQFREIMARIDPDHAPPAPLPSAPRSAVVVQVDDVRYRYETDESDHWYDPDLRRGDYRQQILSHFEAWLRSVQPGSGEERPLRQVFELLFDTNALAVVWNRCLDAAVQAPAALALYVLPLVAAAEVLGSDESREHVAAALTAVYPFYALPRRREIERAVLSLPALGETREQRRWLKHVADTLILALPPGLLALAKTRRRRALLEARADQRDAPEPPYTIPGRYVGSDDDDRFRARGVDISAPAYQRLKALARPIAAFNERPADPAATTDEVRALLPALLALERELRSEHAGEFHPQHHTAARTELSAAAKHVAFRIEWPYQEPVVAWAIEHLLTAARDPEPTPRDVREAEVPGVAHAWAPAPRVDASEGLMRAAWRVDLPAAVRHSLEKTIVVLADDPAPEVRRGIASDLLSLYRTNEALFWQLAGHFVERESHPLVLSHLIAMPLNRLVHLQPGRVAQLSRQLLSRADVEAGDADVSRRLDELVAVAYVSHDEPEAATCVRELLARPLHAAGSLQAIARAVREGTVYGGDDDESRGIRMRTICLYEDIARRTKQEIDRIAAAHADRTGLTEEDERELRSAFQVIDTVAAQLNYAVPDEERGQAQAPVQADLPRLLTEAHDLLEALAGVQHPSVYSHIVDLLGKAVRPAPRATILMLARSLATEGDRDIDARHNERAIVDNVLKIIRVLLTDHRALLQSDEAVRDATISLLDGFVRAGWLEAHEMVVRLEGAVRGR